MVAGGLRGFPSCHPPNVAGIDKQRRFSLIPFWTVSQLLGFLNGLTTINGYRKDRTPCSWQPCEPDDPVFVHGDTSIRRVAEQIAYPAFTLNHCLHVPVLPTIAGRRQAKCGSSVLHSREGDVDVPAGFFPRVPGNLRGEGIHR